ncbi:MAG: hypothetical protein H8E62_10225, partial [Planctomycetes bacterium]|nr:hypothetical protein [Planctomycetota bacterium]
IDKNQLAIISSTVTVRSIDKKIADYQQALAEQGAADDWAGQVITIYVSIPNKSKAIAAKGRFTGEQSSYEQEQDCNRYEKNTAHWLSSFGILNHCAGINHFLMRGLGKCRGEFISLMVLDYNATRILNIHSAEGLLRPNTGK